MALNAQQFITEARMVPQTKQTVFIALLKKSLSPNLWPYRYPYEQKSEIEKLVKEMFDSDTVRLRKSAYSSPMVMVENKDESWGMCPYYR